GGVGLGPAGAAAGQGFVKDVFFVGDEFQSIYGFRHADVAVFRERRERAAQRLPLTQNYRSRPEVLAAVNHLFGGEFGEGYQQLAASGEFPDPVFGHPVELLVSDKRSYHDTGANWRVGEALVSVLASPFVGVSNDALVLIRRHAGKRPLYTGIERSLPDGLSDTDERLIRAFKQRYDRLAAASVRESLERLCEEVVSA